MGKKLWPAASRPSSESPRRGSVASFGRLWWVSTVSTPSAFSASEVSMRMMRPLAVRAPTMVAYVVPGKVISAE